MKIFFSPYELKPRASLSSRADAGARTGALLKIEHKKLGIGYADLHPWPELGDAPLKDQLRLLKDGVFTALTQNSVEFTRIDARARAAGQSLWEGLRIPRSHALVNDIQELADLDQLEALLTQKFERIKIKVGRSPQAEVKQVCQLASRLNKRAKIRLDFNSSLGHDSWAQFARGISPEAEQAIDFIEDPVEWHADHGFGFAPRNFKLAVDRSAGSVKAQNCPDVIVIKPAVSNTSATVENAVSWKKNIVFTSYLDHPVGQLWAAWSAASAAAHASIDICGLLSQNAYEPHPFQTLLKSRGPQLLPPTGPGIGWQDELEELCTWKELT